MGGSPMRYGDYMINSVENHGPVSTNVVLEILMTENPNCRMQSISSIVGTSNVG